MMKLTMKMMKMMKMMILYLYRFSHIFHFSASCQALSDLVQEYITEVSQLMILATLDPSW